MKAVLHLKFIVLYIIFGFLCVFTTATLTTELITERLEKDTSQTLYREATMIADNYLPSYFSNESSSWAVHSQLSAMKTYLNSSLWFVEKDGTMITSANLKDTTAPQSVNNFDPAEIGSNQYMIGTYHNYFQEDMITVMAPVTQGFYTKGYLIIHSPVSLINERCRTLMVPVYISLGVIFLLSFIFLLGFHFFVHRPLLLITEAAKQYAMGNLDYEIPVNRHDEIGYLSASLNYMATQLKDSDDYQKKIVANVSHDFRSPLTSIRGYVEAMADGTIPPELHEKYLNIILFETERLTDLTTDLLTLNEFDTKELLLNKTSFDIQEMIKHTAQSFEGVCTQKHISIKLFLLSEQINVMADRRKIQQVLYNLLDNAIKFSSVDSTITVWGREDILENDQAVLTIWCKDQGIGMSEEFIEHAFDMFAQEKESSRSQYEGTGLGLTIAKALADKMGGTIEFQSKQGVGTTAIIKIPFKLGPQDISSKTTNYDNVSVEGMQVLVVDDNELNVEIAKCMLENNGMKVTCAADGQEAVELFEKSEPGYYGAIFMDVMMPRMDGLEATKTIRNMKRSDAWSIPIIAVSANAFIEDILNSKQAGMNAHLAKPLDVNKLLEALKKCLAENSELKIREDL